MDIVISVVGKVAEYTVDPIGRQASYLIFYQGNLKILADNLKNLEASRERMIHSVEEERGNGREIEIDVVNWLKMANDVIEKGHQHQKDCRRANVRCCAWPFPNLILRHQLSRKATKITNDVVKVQGKGSFDRVGYLPTLDGVASSSSSSKKVVEKYETRGALKEDILKALANLNSQTIGVYGLGGVGKTTLVEEVAKVAKQNNLFDKVVTTHVSKNPDFKTIQGEIADLLGLRFDEETLLGRAHRLRKRIEMEKHILVILDDIWSILDLKKLGIPFGNEHNGCKLLMTSRNQDVLLKMDVPKDFTFKLELMSENEAWSLFKFMAGDVVKHNKLKDIAIQVAQKCACLPLRVVTVACAMKNKMDVESWKDALRKLQSTDHTEMDTLTYSALELSYNSLESDEYRDLFLLCALMHGESVKYFLKIARGLNILKNTDTIDDARNKLYMMIRSLEATCLLLEVKSGGKIQMHDFVCDFAFSIAFRDKHVFRRNQQDVEWPTNEFFKRCTQIILLKCHVHNLSQTIDCPNIKFFHMNSRNLSLEIPDTFFKGMGSLTALDLTYLNMSSLPTSFQFLTNLQTLCLDFCVLGNMKAIESLKNLEILRIWKSSMIKLPREIGRLTQLRMLDLSHSGIEVVPSNIISSLTKLEELYMGDTSVNWEDVNSMAQTENASIVELKKLPRLRALELQLRETWMLPRDLQLMFEKLERYKIAIGDVWEWSNIKDGLLNTLMLKLGSNIHLEHGIKELIKSVESFYLDDVDGIQNVLYQINREGFPFLKHLHVQNNSNIKHIVDFEERNQVHAPFPVLETLVLHNLINLVHICHGPLSITSFGNLSAIKVNKCIQLKYLFSFTMVKGLSRLSNIEVSECNSMKDVVLRDNNSCASYDTSIEKIEFLLLRSLTLEHLETLDNFLSHQGLEPPDSTSFFNTQVAFPNLDTLILSSILNLNKIWDNNHNSMYNLTSLIVQNCGGLKYLFSSTVVGSFINLKYLEISQCPLMEEIIFKEERNNALKEDQFSKLEKLILKDMDNLKTIWHSQFELLKMLQVNNCRKIMVVFPCSMQKTYNKLEMLEVTNCALVEEIFELSSFNENNSLKEDMTHLKEVTIARLPNLKKIWSGDPQGILSFHNLTNLNLENCASLEYLLPLYVATSCSHLQQLEIKYCEKVKNIIVEEKESRVITSTTPMFEFNQLSILLFWNLSQLEGFYAKSHILACPSLKTIDVTNCPKLNLYRTLSTRNSNFLDDHNHYVLMQQPPFIVEEVIPNVVSLRIDHKQENMILQAQNSNVLFTKMTFLGLSFYNNDEDVAFPYWFIQNVPSLESLLVELSSFKKIFQDERLKSDKTHTRIKRLTLSNLPNLQYICEEGLQVDQVLEFLEDLFVDYCSSLISLLPSSATFTHLTYLKTKACNGLKSLITASTARSLNKLTILTVEDCNSLEEIIIGEENIDITFISLEILILECLPSLNNFCSSICFLKFPLLEEVIVRECPRLKFFSEGSLSTPNLRKVQNAENDEQWFWRGNLNNTISSMFEDKVAFLKVKYLALSDYPELKDLWYGQLDHLNVVFGNLKHLVVQRCDFLSHVLFPSNVVKILLGLEELEVIDCDSLEVVFDVKGMKSADLTLIKQSTQLKKLTLSRLSKLKYIWNEDPHEIISFENLSVVNVSMCQSLLYIFPLSLCLELGNLERLEIVSCRVEEIVSLEEGSLMEISFQFPQLKTMKLEDLINLTSFYREKHALECPSLKILDVYGCEALRMFSFNNLDLQQSHLVDENHDIVFPQAMFLFEKLSRNLRELTLNSIDVVEILNQESIFCEVEMLRLQSCEETPSIFLKNQYFHTIFPNFEIFQVRKSSFEILFLTNCTQISKKIKTLWLWELEKLEYIWQDDFPLDHPLLQHLEDLSVWYCPSLITLAPSLTSFTKLTYLEVGNCKELVYLITSSTAKSLTQLKELTIMNCNNMLDIMKIDDEKATEQNIVFGNLEYLKLNSLLRLRSFSYGKQELIFPSLLNFIVESCPEMKIFSSGVTVTPYLTNIVVAEGKNRWKGDLNTTIEQIFTEKVPFPKVEYLVLSDYYPALKDLWCGQLDHHNVYFDNLKHLVVQSCDFLSHVLFPSNVVQVLLGLEELEVIDCDSLEVVFDVKGMKSTDLTLIKQSTQLKKLTLSRLSNLKYIWNEDPHEIISFENLSTVNVSMCQSLLYIFPLSLCRELGNLEILEIVSCRIEEIVALEEGSFMEIAFQFPQLETMKLEHLINLKSFYRKKHALECPSLKILDVNCCEALRMLSFNNLDMQQSQLVGENRDIIFQQAMFSFEKLSRNLRELTLNSIDVVEILNQQSIFCEVEFLRLQSCDETPSIFLKNQYFHTIFPNFEKFQVRNSSFEILFLTTCTQISKKIKTLWIWELEKLEYIWQDDFPLDHPLLQHLEDLSVWYCPSLITLAPSLTSFTKLTYLEVGNCKELVYLITSSTAKSLTQLKELTIMNCNKMLDVVEIDDEKATEENIVFGNLEYLKLDSLLCLRSFCYEKQELIFPSLLNFIVESCPQMKIFSSGVTVTPYLTNVVVSEGKNRWKVDLNTTIEQIFTEKLAFNSFKQLKLSEYPELKELWYGQVDQQDVFRSLKHLVVHKCDFLSEVLFQSNLLQVIMNLEELDIKDCNSLEAVFDLKEIDVVKNSSQLNKLRISNLPKLKHVWKEDPHDTMRFQYLTEIFVEECKSLKSLFPLSVARDMMQLQSLVVIRCSGIEEIVGKEEGIDDVMVYFEFPHLASIILNNLSNLKTFFSGFHYLECKSLKNINLYACPKIDLFYTRPLRCQNDDHDDDDEFKMITTCQPLFFIQEILASAESLSLSSKDFDMILKSEYSRVQFNKVKYITMCECYDDQANFPYWFLKNVPNLEALLVEWSDFEYIFQDELLIKSEEKETQISPLPQLRDLKLLELHNLRYICKEGFQLDPGLQFIENLRVVNCSSLIKMVPSSVTLNYLTYLEVTNCNGLINLISWSTSKSLINLTTMKIQMCNSLEDIVNNGGGGTTDHDTNEIVFCNLQSLELISLPRLSLFCSSPCPLMFPLLENVVVKGCPQMQLFSLGVTNTQILQNVQTEEQEEEEENYWEGDLNRTIKKLFDDKVAFMKLKYLVLSNYPELKDLWYGKLDHHNGLFGNLKHLVVQRCDFLSHVLFPSNVVQVLLGLEELEVIDSDSLEVVFDVKGMKSTDITLIKQSSQLKKLTLSRLSNLKYIWNEDPHEIINFENLSTVNVSLCRSLLYVFPLSLCRELGNLEMLEIVSCRVEEIVALAEGPSMEICFRFPKLKTMKLRFLRNLKSFYRAKHALECPSLKILDVYRCEALRMFSFNNLDLQQSHTIDENRDLAFQQALFSFEKLSLNLRDLTINSTDVVEILNQENIFCEVEILRLQCCDETPSNFLKNQYFHTIFPNLEVFQVRNSSFKTLFLITDTQISKKLKTLWLIELENLEHIWQEGFTLDHPLVQHLEVLYVWFCPRLIILAPSLTYFTKLISLKVHNCEGLVYLITSSTAKSLIQLKQLTIMNCNKMLDVVKIDDEKATEQNIIFGNLEYLKFDSLPCLRSFCYGKQELIFPSLVNFIVERCPQMKIFSSGVTVTQYLTNIVVAEGKKRWKCDLNTTIEQIFTEKVGSPSF